MFRADYAGAARLRSALMLLGLDIGTTSAKAVLLDPSGRTVAEASAAYLVDAPQPGWGETAAEEWWRTTLEVVKGLPPEVCAQVRGIGLWGGGLAEFAASTASWSSLHYVACAPQGKSSGVLAALLMKKQGL